MTRRELIALLGAAGAWPLTARAEQLMPVIGYLSVGSPETDNIPWRLVAFRRGLGEAGYVEGQNLAIEYRWAEGQYDRLPALAADLVQRQVTVIVTPGAPPTFAAKTVTSKTPIVFAHGIDPVESGLVASLSRPGGNVTGISLLQAELVGKRLELLHELLPRANVVALLVNPSNSVAESEARNLETAAHSLGLELQFLQASAPNEVEAAFETLVRFRADALVVSADTLFTSQRAQIVALAARHAVPAVYVWREFTEGGGLMSYGADLADTYRLLGIYTVKILAGAKPADLPVQQVVRVELVINLKTAKSLGLTIPPILLARADEVIE